MARTYKVKQGEHLVQIAWEHGFVDYHTIWDYHENAELKQKRQNPHVLFPGDSLTLPEKDEKAEDGATGQRHRFRLQSEPLLLRLVVKDLNDEPLADTACTLQVELNSYDLITDGAGGIEQTISPTAENGKLLIEDIEIPIKIGYLDPVEELSGQMARLNNLGYSAGGIDDFDDLQFRSAVEEFQCDHNLVVDGICGFDTQAKLKDIHGC